MFKAIIKRLLLSHFHRVLISMVVGVLLILYSAECVDMLTYVVRRVGTKRTGCLISFYFNLFSLPLKQHNTQSI